MDNTSDESKLVDSKGRSLRSSRSSSWWQRFKGALERSGGSKLGPYLELIPSKIRWIVILLVLIAPVLWSTYDTWSNFPVIKEIITKAKQQPLPKTDQFSVAVTHLEGDKNDELQALILDSLRAIHGIKALRFDRTTLFGSANDPQAEEIKIHSQARKWLDESDADILLWGRILPATAKNERKLRFFLTCKNSQLQESARISENDLLELPVSAHDIIESVIRSQVLARLNVFDDSHPVAKELRREIDRLNNLIEQGPQDGRYGLKNAYANALVIIGRQSGDNDVLAKAIEVCLEALKETTRERVPLDWATTQNNLGNALVSLGERESGTARLEQAAQAYQEALKERTRERVPLDWAETQNDLGFALLRLGERESGTTRLALAVQAYQEALKERTREQVPLDWAMTQKNLGNVLLRLGEREKSPARLEQAAQAYREALKEWTRERVPLYWAMTQNNLGAALEILARWDSGTSRLEQAVQAHQEALKECTRERVPLYWASTQDSLGTVLLHFGVRESNTARLEQAAQAYQEALKERTRERVPLDWAMTQNNLGLALQGLGKRENDTSRLERAIKAYHLAIDVFQDSQSTSYLNMAQRNLQSATALLERKRGKTDQKTSEQ